jgi:hypothetical protein
MTPQDTPTPQKDMKVLLQMNEQLATTNAKLERSLAAAQAHMELAKNVVRAWKLYKRKYAEGFCGDIYWVGVEQELDELCSALTPHGIGRTVVFREDYDALHTRLRAAERDAALWNGLALLHPMDIATVICGAPDEKAMMAGLAKRIRAALAGSAQEE